MLLIEDIKNSSHSVTHSHSDEHVVDTKFDSDDILSLLIKRRRVHTVQVKGPLEIP